MQSSMSILYRLIPGPYEVFDRNGIPDLFPGPCGGIPDLVPG